MEFSLIGTGRMAWFLAQRLQTAGHHLHGVWGRNEGEAVLLATAYHSEVYQNLSAIPDREQHFCLLAVSDTALEQIAQKLRFDHTFLVHHAGGESIEVLQHAARHYGVLWPVYSITKADDTTFPAIPLAIEGNTPATGKSLSALAASISSNVFTVTADQRSRLHLAAVFANNFTNHLLSVSEMICTEAALPFTMLKPIIGQTFERISGEGSPRLLQTGPAIRDDRGTMATHLRLLAGHPLQAALYEMLSASIRKMYESPAD